MLYIIAMILTIMIFYKQHLRRKEYRRFKKRLEACPVYITQGEHTYKAVAFCNRNPFSNKYASSLDEATSAITLSIKALEDKEWGYHYYWKKVKENN